MSSYYLTLKTTRLRGNDCMPFVIKITDLASRYQANTGPNAIANETRATIAFPDSPHTLTNASSSCTRFIRFLIYAITNGHKLTSVLDTTPAAAT